MRAGNDRKVTPGIAFEELKSLILFFFLIIEKQISTFNTKYPEIKNETYDSNFKKLELKFQ
jgi:hypothetical protein